MTKYFPTYNIRALSRIGLLFLCAILSFSCRPTNAPEGDASEAINGVRVDNTQPIDIIL